MRVKIAAPPRVDQENNLSHQVSIASIIAAETIPVASQKPVSSHAANSLRPQWLHRDAAVSANGCRRVE